MTTAMMPANMKLDEAGLRSLPVNSVVIAQGTMPLDGKAYIAVWRRYDHGWLPLTNEHEWGRSTSEMFNYQTFTTGIRAEKWTCVWLGDGAVHPW